MYRLVLALAAVALGLSPSSLATFKGPNGRLAFQKQAGAHTQVFTITADGTGLRQVTHFKERR